MLLVLLLTLFYINGDIWTASPGVFYFFLSAYQLQNFTFSIAFPAWYCKVMLALSSVQTKSKDLPDGKGKPNTSRIKKWVSVWFVFFFWQTINRLNSNESPTWSSNEHQTGYTLNLRIYEALPIPLYSAKMTPFHFNLLLVKYCAMEPVNCMCTTGFFCSLDTHLSPSCGQDHIRVWNVPKDWLFFSQTPSYEQIICRKIWAYKNFRVHG